MPDSLPLIPQKFAPSASLTGNENPTSVYRGENCFIRGVDGFLKVRNYEGSKDLGEDHDISGETLSGEISFTAESDEVTGVDTLFTTELHTGQFILVDTEVLAVRRIESDTLFYAERAPETSASAQTGYFLPVLFEIDKTRGVLRRGNAVKVDKGDILLVGDGAFYRNGVDTGFTASRTPKRLQYNEDGTYTEKPLGFRLAPPVPVITAVAGGVRKLQDGKYSFMISFYNSKTRGFSNPCPAIKQNGSSADLEIVTATPLTRWEFDFTNPLAAMPENADGFIIWQSLSGGGVAATNATYFNQGPWQMAARVKTAPRDVLSANAATDTLYVKEHHFKTGDIVYFTGGSLPAGISAATAYYAIVVDSAHFKIASTYQNALAGTVVDITADGTGTCSPLDASDKYLHECLDSELGMVATGDNDAPADCEFLCEFSNTVFAISCLGKKTGASPDGTNPGNYVLMAKPSNKEAFPYGWAVSVGGEINGFAAGIGRLFCLTEKGIPFVTATGRTEIARLVPTLIDFPFTSRDFWTKGGINPYQITIIQGDVFLYSGRRVLMSPRGADEFANPFEIGKAIQDLTADIPAGFVFLRHCPKNQQLLVIASAVEKNSAGYWVSKIFPLDLENNAWQPTVKLSSDTRDMIVTGADIINDRLEFLAGGRVEGGALTVSTYRYDERDGATAVPYFFAFQPSDLGEEQLAKRLKSIRVTGRVTNPIVQIHGATAADGTLSIADIEAGTNSVSGDILMETTTAIVRAPKKNYVVKNLYQWCLRFSGVWAGAGEVDEIEEIVVEIETHGGRG